MAVIKKLVKWMLTISILFYLVHTSHLNLHLLANLFKSPVWLLAVICLYGLSVMVSAWRWRRLSSIQSVSTSYVNYLVPTYIGIAFNNLLPGGIGGDFYRFYYLSRRTELAQSEVFIILLLDRVLGLMGAVGLLGGISLITLVQGERNGEFHTWYELIIALNLSFVLGFYVLFMFSHRLNKFFINLKREIKYSLVTKLFELNVAILKFKSNKKILIEAAIASVVVQVLVLVSCVLCTNLLGLSMPSVTSLGFGLVLCQIVNLLPITPGGIGVGEVAFSNILIIMNHNHSIAYATIYLTYRLIGYLFYLPSLSLFLINRFFRPSYSSEQSLPA